MGTHPIFESDFDCLTVMARFRSFSTLHATWLSSLLASFIIGLINQKCETKLDQSLLYIPKQPIVPVNILVPMHLSHYDQISDVIKGSFESEEVFVHSESDVNIDNWQFREF